MQANIFLNYIGYYGLTNISGTALQGIYNLNSNSGNSSIFYNLLYPTGNQFTGNNIIGTYLPLINLSQSIPFSGNFTGQVIHAGYILTGNYGLILDLQYSGCGKRSQYLGQDYVLLSSVQNPSGYSSGFAVTINDSNRLSFITTGFCYTLDKELSNRNFVYFNLTNNQYVNLSIYDVYQNKVSRADITVPTNSLNTNDIYIGGFLNNTNTGNYTNFSGQINSIALFNNPLTNSNFSTCANGLLATGYTAVSNNITVSGMQVTGIQYSGINIFTYTGTNNITGTLQTQTGSINVIFANELTGLVQTGVSAVPMFGYTGINIPRSTTQFLFDPNVMNSFATYNVEFGVSLTSGDIVEIITYPTFNSNVNLPVSGFSYPGSTGFIQLYANGLDETLGTDYQIIRGQLSGYDTIDILSYDILPSSSVVTAFSGLFSESAIALSGGIYFPPQAQYYESTGITGQVVITGLSGVCVFNPYYPLFGFDLHIQGQRLVSGTQYYIANSGISGFNIYLSGTSLPTFRATTLYSNGIATGVANVDTPELSFLPNFSQYNLTQYFINTTQNIISNVTGYNATVFLNGIRQYENDDYVRGIPCSFVSGFITLPTELSTQIYNSETDEIGLFNYV